ncbi:MAG: glycerol-3-phosphate acyltransferase [Ardenticatenia bacterium]|nr:glycerol-3-phosphate acyltransferase [Ardenticatenia bacterium]
MWGALLIAALIGYLLGALPSGLIVARALGSPDPRTYGSGHLGGSNVARRAGVGAGVLVFLADAAKGVVAGVVGGWLAGPWGIVLAGTLAVVGHCWSIFAGGHGGMGLSTAGALLAWLSPPVLIMVIFVWLAAYLIVRERYLGVFITLPTVPLLLQAVSAPTWMVAFGLAVTLLLFARFAAEFRRAKRSG